MVEDDGTEESVAKMCAAKIRLRDPSEKMQLELKNWCFENINNTILPKIWLFE
jgi:hypothetical protein